jgi:metallo-beta-lactamase class B
MSRNPKTMNLNFKSMCLNHRSVARLLVLLLVGLTCVSLRAQSNPDWTTPLPPFRIAGNLYYVGSRDLASYLVVTPAGDILINSNLATSPPQIRHSVEQLGFRFSDIKILLISHAHFDHAGGSAQILRETHAKYMVMDSDVSTVESGGRTDFAFGPKPQMAAAHVDRVLHDGDRVQLGGTVLVAHKTPGHTPGCTSWTMVVNDNGKPRNVVIVGSWSVLSEYRLVATRTRPTSYPGIAQDFSHTFDVLGALPCDIFLGAHGIYFDMLAKLARMPTEGPAVWIDPQGYKRAVAHYRRLFEDDLSRQQAAATAPKP